MSTPSSDTALALVPCAAPTQGMEVLTDHKDEEFTGLSDTALCEKIRNCDRQATGMASVAQQAIKQSLGHVIGAGSALIAAKARLQHGQWEAWLDSNLPEIPRSRISRYMAAAERISHVTNMDAIKSVRQLYLATGVIADPGGKSPSKGVAQESFAPENFVARIRSLCNFFQGTDAQLRPGVFDAELSEQLISEIQLLTELLSAIQERLRDSSMEPSAANQRSTASGAPSTKISKLPRTKTPRKTGKTRKKQKKRTGAKP